VDTSKGAVEEPLALAGPVLPASGTSGSCSSMMLAADGCTADLEKKNSRGVGIDPLPRAASRN
jgi:hypothetical protein